MKMTMSANPADYPMHTHREFEAAIDEERARAARTLQYAVLIMNQECNEKLAAERERCANLFNQWFDGEPGFTRAALLGAVRKGE